MSENTSFRYTYSLRTLLVITLVVVLLSIILDSIRFSTGSGPVLEKTPTPTPAPTLKKTR